MNKEIEEALRVGDDRKVEEYIKQLEFNVEAAEKEHEHDVAMIDEVKGVAVKLYRILNKVTDKLKQFKTDLKEHEKKYEYKKDISTRLIGVRINAILKIIEGEKKE